MARYLYSELSTLLTAFRNYQDDVSGNPQRKEWADKHESMIEQLVKDHMPRGSGFDSGTTLDTERSHAEKLVFETSFHHMNENGFYDGWTEHNVTVTPSLANALNLRVSGRNRNDIKELIYEQFRHALQTNVEWDIMRQWPDVAVLNLEIKYEWIDQCTGIHVVKHNGQTVYNGTLEAKASHFYANPIELCRAFCVSYARKLTGKG